LGRLVALCVTYEIVFNGADFHAKLAAVEAGIGLVVMPESTVPSNLIKAKEYYLPPLPAIKVLLCVHLGLETDQALAAHEAIVGLLFEKPGLRV
jgi:DNA-binding transcriptional LysR family regulator